MSFNFQWPRFSDQFHSDTIQLLNNALNKGNKPPVIADKIEVVELEMGTHPPELEIRDIGDLTMDQFRGIFRMSYAGDAHIVLKTKVQANPLNHKQTDIHLLSGSRGMLAAKEALVVPMLLRLSHIKLASYVVLVVSRSKGITLVFKTDPLQSVDISSSFDGIAVIQKFIQKEIEGQLRQMFKEDLPGIIHRLSQQWVKPRVEAPKIPLSTIRIKPTRRAFDALSAPDTPNHRLPPLTIANVGLRQFSADNLVDPQNSTRSSSSTGSRRSRRSMQHTKSPLASPPMTPFDAEDSEAVYDPTYGLRPEGVPANSMFTSFGRLFAPSKGLGDLAEDEEDLDSLDPESEPELSDHSDEQDWEVTPSVSHHFAADQTPEHHYHTEFDTAPAVGGGTVPKPRVLHATRSLSYSESASTSTQRSLRPNASHANSSHGYFSGEAPASAFNTSYTSSDPIVEGPEAYRSNSPESNSSDPTYSIATPSATTADEDIYVNHPSRESSFSGSPPRIDHQISLQHNHSIHQLSTLSHSNHTLSPYTRSLSHFTVRSVPPRFPKDHHARERGALGRPPEVKARRKRLFRLGSFGSDSPASTNTPPTTNIGFEPIPASAVDAEDLDLYFPPSRTTSTSEERPVREVS